MPRNMIDVVRLKYRGPVPRHLIAVGIGQEDFNAMVKQSLVPAGHLWHEKFRPKHFTTAGALEYGYYRRQSEPDFESPLVESGELQEATETYRIRTIAFSTKTEMRVIMPRAYKANYRPKNSAIRMYDELTFISPSEHDEMAAVAEEEMERLLAADVRTSEVEIRG